MQVKRGDLFFANLNPVIGSEQGGLRPVLIVQNDIGNNYSPTTSWLPLLQLNGQLPTHVEIKKNHSLLSVIR